MRGAGFLKYTGLHLRCFYDRHPGTR